MPDHFLTKFNRIKAFIFDIDGVMTDGSVSLIGGEMVRTMNSKDGYALQLAVKKGYQVAFISGGTSESMRSRLKGLGVRDVYMGASNKLEVLEDHLMAYDIDADNVLYMGDDIPDFDVMKKVGLATCPADAAKEIKQISQYITVKTGGNGCVREVIEKVLALHGNWFKPELHANQLMDYTW